MIPGISGTLLSIEALERVVPVALRGRLGEGRRDAERAALRRWHLPLRATLGPASGARACFDLLAVPMFARLGYRILPERAARGLLTAVLQATGRPVAALAVTDWAQTTPTLWRDAVRLGIGLDVPWCFCVSGRSVRLVDSRRTFSRRHLEFDIETALDDERAFAAFWGLLRADALEAEPTGGESLLDGAVRLSERHRTAVRAALQDGVHDALQCLMAAFASAARRAMRSRSVDRPAVVAFDESLVVIYRILFLLFAEARGLVPAWHPVFREGYTIESLRGAVERLPRPRGVWETLQAIARLAHRGCRVGSLRVPPFNGHLFSPSHAPLADTLPLDDGAVRRALLALTTRPSRAGRERISYADLGVEHLGGVYERLLELQPSGSGTSGSPALAKGEARKSTGSFYTPRSITEYLVRRTLAPLVDGLPADGILELRILDPAMGSGAFLVAACRYLAAAYERAAIRDGVLSAGDVTDRDRAAFRRAIAQRCLYGVDLNPTAVQLGRLSLWLASLAADAPLTFLDHRLRAGNSLVGAKPSDVARQPPGSRRGRRRNAVLTLFSDEDLEAAVTEAVIVRGAIATEPGDTLEQVRGKERALARLQEPGSRQERWRAVLDLWCSGWFRGAGSPTIPASGFATLADALLGRSTGLPDHIAGPMLEDARRAAAGGQFFHWPIEFPEIFYSSSGAPLPSPGFDAVIGNPPWEMVRGDRGGAAHRAAAREAARGLIDFARTSGVYSLQGEGHANLYQLFLERALQLVKEGGRFGLVLPSGFATDLGSATLRRTLLDGAAIDGFVSLENRDGVFPIHRGLRFLLVTATAGGSTTVVPSHAGVRTPDALDRLPDAGADPEALPLTRSMLQQLSGTQAVIPDIRTTTDLEIVCDLVHRAPALGDADGWHARFGRELNASDDRRYFCASPDGLPVIEGKQVAPFSIDLSRARFHIPRAVAARLVDPARTFRRSRLAYRDVASATNRLTLIAAIVPEGVLTTHTLFCLKDELDLDAQEFLCGIFNSYVANYLVRMRVTTHLSAAIVERLPVPRPARAARVFVEIVDCTRALRQSPVDAAAYARLQARAAQAFGLNRHQFGRVLETFPLVPPREREEAVRAFYDIVG